MLQAASSCKRQGWKFKKADSCGCFSSINFILTIYILSLCILRKVGAASASAFSSLLTILGWRISVSPPIIQRIVFLWITWVVSNLQQYFSCFLLWPPTFVLRPSNDLKAAFSKALGKNKNKLKQMAICLFWFSFQQQRKNACVNSSEVWKNNLQLKSFVKIK